MNAGRLRHRVWIDAGVDTQDATTGEPVRSWSPVVEVWAEIKPVRGREAMVNGGILAQMDTRITVRPPSGFDLTAKHRIRHIVNGQTIIYNVVSPAETLLEHNEVEVMCKSGQNEG